MINAAIYTDTIAAGQTSRRLFSGAFFKIISATGALNVRTDVVRLNGLVSGQGFEKAPFTFLELTDASGASNTIRYTVATEGFLDGITGSMQITSQVPVRSGSFTNTQNTVTSGGGLLTAANSVRSYWMVQNKDLAGKLYIGFGSQNTVANGVYIEPGGNYLLEGAQSTQAIYAIGDVASNVNVVTVEG